jgi:hypothetical protein
MGAGSTEDNVLLFLSALEACLTGEGFTPAHSGSSAAAAFYAANPLAPAQAAAAAR